MGGEMFKGFWMGRSEETTWKTSVDRKIILK
jgi:hypothetical protein